MARSYRTPQLAKLFYISDTPRNQNAFCTFSINIEGVDSSNKSTLLAIRLLNDHHRIALNQVGPLRARTYVRGSGFR